MTIGAEIEDFGRGDWPGLRAGRDHAVSGVLPGHESAGETAQL